MTRPRVQVARKIDDNLGELLPGALPSLERAAAWPENNFRAMMNAGFLKVYGGDEPPTHLSAAEQKAAELTEKKAEAAAKAAAKPPKKTTSRGKTRGSK